MHRAVLFQVLQAIPQRNTMIFEKRVDRTSPSYAPSSFMLGANSWSKPLKIPPQPSITPPLYSITLRRRSEVLLGDRIPFWSRAMDHREFTIGIEFTSAGTQWRCTDRGTRTVIAIRLDTHPDDPSWYNGPPYAVAEMVFDEYDLEACEPVAQKE